MRLHYLVKLEIRVFVKILMLEKGISRNLTLSLLVKNDATFWLWHHVMANLIRKTCTKLYQNRPHFVNSMTKNI